ncbi:hypothetical protein SCE1572_02265 [Sorangium cellulosum So0157-2]|uniref:Uncharacterized protein n=1 Tax=Sorangium cellulosum So0157-2 TaxID=1254432 RepID=S4XJT6_SORCE|nr:hypothetical protein SCE1572_02265 [Sorangium cellulosum So0157-2]
MASALAGDRDALAITGEPRLAGCLGKAAGSGPGVAAVPEQVRWTTPAFKTQVPHAGIGGGGGQPHGPRVQKEKEEGAPVSSVCALS